MRVLVMGGTRFNGLALVRELVKHGHEVTTFNRGLTEAVLAECDTVGFIPQLGRVGSLNVAAAAAIAVYEARRQAWTTSDRRSDA